MDRTDAIEIAAAVLPSPVRRLIGTALIVWMLFGGGIDFVMWFIETKTAEFTAGWLPVMTGIVERALQVL